MKTLELVARKNTTAKARESVVKFIKSFNFDEYTDIVDVESKIFHLLYEPGNRGMSDLHDTAYFRIDKHGFRIVTYLSEDTEQCIYQRDIEAVWESTEAHKVFDVTCNYISFKGLIAALEDLVLKVNKNSAEKETEIADFLEYAEGWNSFQNTLKNAKEVEASTEIV